MNKIKAILFDLDETLLVEWDSARHSFIETIKRIDSGIDENEFVKAIREEARKLWYVLPTIKYCRRIGISSWEALWADFSGSDSNLKMLSRLAAEYRMKSWKNALVRFGIRNGIVARELSDTYMEIRNARHIVFPDAIECLNNLKPLYKLGLITNGAMDLQWKKINGSHLKPYFHAIVISSEYGFAKPDVRLFRKELSLLQCTAKNSIMVGDSLDTDIKGAKEAGILAVWINRDGKVYNDPVLKPDYEIASLSELQELFVLIQNKK
jgi:putative hydrolase of the HAD superfamily